VSLVIFRTPGVYLSIPSSHAVAVREIQPAPARRLLDAITDLTGSGEWPLLFVAFAMPKEGFPVLSVHAPAARGDGVEIVREVRGVRIWSVLDRPRSRLLEVRFAIMAYVDVGLDGGEWLRASASVAKADGVFATLRLAWIPIGRAGMAKEEDKSVIQAMVSPNHSVDASIHWIPPGNVGALVATGKGPMDAILCLVPDAHLLDGLLSKSATG